jgi:ferredoxin
MLEVCEARGVPLVNFEASGPVKRSVDGRIYHVARAAAEADYIVSVAKFKTHVLTLLTGAIKNLFGSIPGFRKSTLHLENPRPRPMSRALVDVFSLVPPWVSVVDGVVAMDGNGPSSGRLRKLAFLAAGSDSVALDAVLAKIAGVHPMQVPTTAEAYRRGLGDGPLERTEFPLLRPEQVAPADFRIPGNWKFSLIPGFAGRVLGSLLWIKPVIAVDVCTGCGECVDVCPADAITMDDKKAAVSRGLCISCLCCHETCPAGAVRMRKSRLAGLIS